MCHPCGYAIISQQDLVCLNSNLFMKIAKVLDSIILNAIFPSSTPVRHLPALFCYLLNTYDHSFWKVFNISQLILKIYIMLFPDAPNVTHLKFFSIWYIILPPPSLNSGTSFLTKIKDSILSELFNSLLMSS